MKLVEYIIGDSREVEKIFAKKKIKKVDLILTSPPYFDILNYENSENQIGYKQSYEKYLEDITDIYQQCYRISNNNATLWIVVDTIRKDSVTITLPFDIINKLKSLFSNNTWILRDVIIWNKYKNIPWFSKGRFKNQFEYILFLSKNNDYKYHIDNVREIADYKKWWLTYPERYNPKGKPPSNIWEWEDIMSIWEFIIPIRGWGNGYQKHLCPFPFPLIERILSISSDERDVIFDPFAGSGSVLALAKEMKRYSIGIDINKKYKEQFEKEVLIGAKKYWNNRKKELRIIRGIQTRFGEINFKLRKIKACIKLIQILKDFFKDYIFILIDHRDDLEQASCVLIKNSNVKNLVDVSIFNNPISNLSREFKIKINLEILDQNQFFSIYPDVKEVFSYSEAQRFKFIENLSIKELFKEKRSSDCLYSDIKLNINKYSDLYKK